MASVSDNRLTVLEIIQEVRRKLSILAPSSVTQDANSTVLLDYLNDTIDEINDYGDWKEMVVECTITASTSVRRYTLAVSADIKNIHSIYFSGNIPPLQLRSIDDMLRWRQLGGTGVPRNWAIMGVDNVTTGNPIIEVYPQPGPNENNSTFNIYAYQKIPRYSASDSAVLVPFDSGTVVSGTLMFALLDDDRTGQDAAAQKSIFDKSLSEAFNRFNGDSGSNTRFVPMYRGKRRP